MSSIASIAYDRINSTAPKGEKEEIKAHVEEYDSGSVNGFIQRAGKETMERDKAIRKAIEKRDGAENQWEKIHFPRESRQSCRLLERPQTRKKKAHALPSRTSRVREVKTKSSTDIAFALSKPSAPERAKRGEKAADSRRSPRSFCREKRKKN